MDVFMVSDQQKLVNWSLNFYGSQEMQKSLIKHVLDWLMVKHLSASD